MYLKRLELQGFKSFPTLTKIEFNEGITSIVGPNGSGKSNISDAIRWVLGEKSAKNLRGGKMEDVIFAGTDLKKPLSYAKVTLVIDNKENMLPVETEEVCVTRKLYRSSENEYFINNKGCRLKDIYELFMDTGIGKEGYSIIGQGKIDEILSGKSDERRLLIEEAVGIVKYKNRKKEAESKLQKERANLELVENTLEELEKQVKPLEEQSKKAKIFLEIQEQLKKAEINIFIRDIDSFNDEIEKVKNQLSLIEKDLFDLNQERILQMQKAELNNIKLNQTKKVIETNKKNLVENRVQTEQKYNDIKLFKEQIKNIEENQNRLNLEENSIHKKINIFDVEYTRLILEQKTLSNSLNEKETELEQNEKILNNLKSELEKYEEEVIKFNADIDKKNKKLIDLKYKIDINSDRKNQFNLATSKVNEEILTLKNAIIEKNKVKDDLTNVIDELTIDLQNLKDKVSIELDEVRNMQESHRALTNDKNNLQNEFNSVSTKEKLLKDYENQYEGYFYSVKFILQEAKKNMLQGVLGTVGELISVDEKYETAIEIALGSRMQNIVTNNSQSAKECINYLKKNKKGRATFLPIDMIKPISKYKNYNNILKEKGVIGIAKDLIVYDSKYENIYSSLLERVLIVDNLDNATYISKKYNSEIKIVTLVGDVLSVGGSMTGGSINKKSSKLLGRAREIEELTQEKEKIYKQLQLKQSEIEEIEKRIFNKNEDIKNFNDEIQKNSILLNNKQQERNSELKSINEIEENILSKNNSILNEQKELDNINESINNSKREYENTEEELIKLKQTFDEYKNNVNDTIKNKDDKVNKVYSLKIEFNELNLKAKSLEDNVKINLQNVEEQKEKLLNIQNTKEEYEISIVNKKENIKQSEIDIENYKNEKVDLEKLIKEDKEKSQVLENEIHTLREKTVSLAEEIQALEKNQIKVEYNIKNLEEKNRKSYDEMWDNYNLTYNNSKEYYDETLNYNKLQKDKLRLKDKIKSLGNINVNAIEQFIQVNERFKFLSSQRNDIVETEQKLDEIIQELSTMIEDKFKENFNVICKNFDDVFKDIFGGGFAKLILTDETNVLTSGIEIEVKPPGKSLKNISLLSGGERSLTAIALLFAILKMKPSPFCVLDEIEAALDDNNVYILAEFLRKFSENTQFIMISHKKGIMEISNIIYGVTMKEQGVSSLLSIDFDNI